MKNPSANKKSLVGLLFKELNNEQSILWILIND